MSVLSATLPRRAARALSRELLVFFALLALTVALRAPFAGNVEEDEAFFALVGRDWLQGALPYVDRFDVKPPGLFLIYALAERIFGAGLATIKGIEIAFVVAAAYGLWRIGRDHLSRPVGLAAAALYPIYSLGMGGVNVPAELILNAFEVFAVLAALCCARDREPARAALCGLLFGCAFAIKQSAALEAGAVLAALLLEAPDWRTAARWLLAFCLAGAAAPLAFALYFLGQGHFMALWTQAVLAAGGRLGGDNVGFLGGLARLPGGLKPALVLVAGAAMTLMRLKSLTALSQPLRLCVGWLVGAAAALVAMRGMYDHYFLPLVAPLLLLAGVALFVALDFGPPRRAVLSRASLLLAAALCPLAVAGFDNLRGGGEDRKAVLVSAQAARAAGLAPGDAALVVNRGLMFLVETGAAPTSRLFHPQHLLCDFPLTDGDVLAQAMATRPRFVLMADTRLGMVCEKEARLEALKSSLARDYALVSHVAGDWDSYDLYRLK